MNYLEFIKKHKERKFRIMIKFLNTKLRKIKLESIKLLISILKGVKDGLSKN